MRYIFIAVLVGILLYLILIISLGSGAEKLSKVQQVIKEKCVETELYSFQYRGPVSRIYDCTGVDIK